MCGIAGVYYLKNQKEELIKEAEERVKKINKLQKHRGPDQEGFLSFKTSTGFISLVHQRLSILDLSEKGKQPMIRKTKTGGELIIVYNGEVYNFLELKKELIKKGYQFFSNTDTEVILALYEEYQEHAFGLLEGMFAFALFDRKKEVFYLVRDRFGIKPVYYYFDQEKLFFSSEAKSLIKADLVEKKTNLEAIYGFLLFGAVPGDLTIFEDIFLLKPGYFLKIENQKAVFKKYYSLIDSFKSKTNDQEKEIIEKIRYLLKKSVKLHLISDAPLGVFLSGGIDSSVLSLEAASLRERPLTTLSISFFEKNFSEEKYQKLIVEKINSSHFQKELRKEEFFEKIKNLEFDQPTIDGLNTFFISLKAKEVGLKAVLSGLGADEIFLGYHYFEKARFFSGVQKLPPFLKNTLLAFAKIKSNTEKIDFLKRKDVLGFYLSLRGLFSVCQAAKIIGASQNEIESFLDELKEDFLNEDFSEIDPVNLFSYLELKFYLHHQLLKDTDYFSMLNSVEIRVPFLYHPLVEYLAQAPSRIKLKKPKYLLIEAEKDILPKEIYQRKKMGFTFPFELWLKEKAKDFEKEISFNQLERTFFEKFLKNKIHWSKVWAIIVLKKFI